MKDKIQANEKYLPITYDKGLVSRINKELSKLNNMKANNPIKWWAKHFNRHFIKEDTQISNSIERCASLVTRETQNRVQRPLHPIRRAKIKNGDIRW